MSGPHREALVRGARAWLDERGDGSVEVCGRNGINVYAESLLDEADLAEVRDGGLPVAVRAALAALMEAAAARLKAPVEHTIWVSSLEHFAGRWKVTVTLMARGAP